ncbi:MAG: bifunctional homocysteine S-methyltransferase/methylenetetrahydrofolate reductase [Sedimentisphaerales bacterium]|nr:bifunctional homocysteine S-methyltransferase/methylenetetrahydrofolate reductase [Sedimentisphaerales bacterium]
MKNGLWERLSRQTVIGDGAMGTMLYQQGIFLNTCFDELNLSHPDLVKKIHRAYVEVGVDFIETNTFGANEFKLAKYSLADKLEEINHAGVEIAKSACTDTDVLIAGSIGPLGVPLAPFGRLTPEQACIAFERHIKALVKAGVDFLILETFQNPDELLIALDAVRAVTELPVIAQVTTNEYQETSFGQKTEQAIAQVASHPAVTAVGLNCSIGPAIMLSTLDRIRTVTNKPISLQPNAGLPRDIEGRTIYMCTPEYMAEFAKRFHEKGARIIGGCCGTTPEHINQIVRAVRALDKASLKNPQTSQIGMKVQTSPHKPPATRQPAVPLAQKSNWGRKLANQEMVTSIEITPPRGSDLSVILDKARLCASHGIDAINIPDGPRASSRVSPMVTAIEILRHCDIEPILHVCCRDRNIIGLQSDMLGAHAVGLRNMLIITGDPPKLGEYPDATAVFDLDSIGLTTVVHNLNRGIDIGSNSFTPPLALTLGVGANPVATDLEREIERFRLKVEAGAEYAITQPVFDVNMLFKFLDAIESFNIPIIAGIWPFTSFKNAEFMANEVPGVVVPKELLDRMAQPHTKEQARHTGIEIAQEMIQAISPRVAGIAVSAPFGNVQIALAVLNKIDINEINP